ncbi:MAG: mitochondrial ATPase complex subunit ATP10 [candidate division KSB1 bacterium]|nr:mitochondrial ATPase complex subunit ATP10 [candidate division KSB1 bacterium]MDZ7335835.1 mitochondrial ATPase complex subunit ATP10 [candidate division KSB1 bacterium]MDZ7356170.1 mitochondrial ATPase complex subunit ATP10 [candidate division KSB1 bacterium]MDZ7375612.1 mitochondrial ATPase complex subunit ATP10 [candidate division KSB1 bacterium]MDZ7400313.1 mitochondrial ATPase complex subunit ATP10 [candidate division KSB1 bacterium]
MDSREIGKPFPELKAETLSGIEIKYPDDLQGKITLILIAFKRETQLKIDSWLEPFSKVFSADTSVQFFEIPMLSAGWKLMSPIIDGGMRSGIPKQKHGNVTTFYGNVDKYCEQLGIKDKSDAYIFLLDPEGKIQWRSNGFATQEKLKELFERIETLKNSF